MADLVASAAHAVRNRPKLCQASLGEILHALLLLGHRLDRRLLLLYGLDGECNVCVDQSRTSYVVSVRNVVFVGSRAAVSYNRRN